MSSNFDKDFDRHQSDSSGLSTRAIALHRRMKSTDLASLRRPWQRILVLLYRFAILLIEGIDRTEMARRAAALTYTTILSIFPLLALISFTASAFYTEDREAEYTTWIQERLIPATPELAEADMTEEEAAALAAQRQFGEDVQRIFTRASDTFRQSAAGVGVFGVIGLLITCGLLYYSIDSTVNLTWRSSEKQWWTRTLTNFITVLFFAPLIIGLSITGTGTAVALVGGTPPNGGNTSRPAPVYTDDRPAAETAPVAADQATSPGLVMARTPPAEGPGLFSWLREHLANLKVFLISLNVVVNGLVLALAYSFIPRTSVNFLHALIGALVASILWEVARYVFFTYVYLSFINRTLTDILGVSVIFLLWIYITWVILLLGNLLVYTMQNYQFLWEEKKLGESMRLDARLVVAVMLILAAKFMGRGGGLTERDLRRRTGLGQEEFRSMMAMLVQRGYVTELEDEAFQIGRPPGAIRLREIMQLGCDLSELPVVRRSRGRLADVLARFQKRSLDQAGDLSLDDLLRDGSFNVDEAVSSAG